MGTYFLLNLHSCVVGHDYDESVAVAVKADAARGDACYVRVRKCGRHSVVQLATLYADMASVIVPLDQPSNYKDSQSRVDRQRQHDLLSKSTTLYVRFTHKAVNPHALLTLTPCRSEI
jgi:hypothetical protein